MGNHKTKTKIQILAIVAAATLLLAFSGTANASSYNFGTLDVQPVEKNGATTDEWFVEYLKPGENRQEQPAVGRLDTRDAQVRLEGQWGHAASNRVHQHSHGDQRPDGAQEDNPRRH